MSEERSTSRERVQTLFRESVKRKKLHIFAF